MTELQEAIAWLRDNQPGLKLASSYASLVPGNAPGKPTVRKVSVILEGPTYSVSGEGPTILDAVKCAVGAK
jgi:hypothetical protein